MCGYKQARVLKIVFTNEIGKAQMIVPEYLDIPHAEWVANSWVPRENGKFQPIHELDNHRVHVHHGHSWKEGPDQRQGLNRQSGPYSEHQRGP